MVSIMVVAFWLGTMAIFGITMFACGYDYGRKIEELETYKSMSEIISKDHTRLKEELEKIKCALNANG